MVPNLVAVHRLNVTVSGRNFLGNENEKFVINLKRADRHIQPRRCETSPPRFVYGVYGPGRGAIRFAGVSPSAVVFHLITLGARGTELNPLNSMAMAMAALGVKKAKSTGSIERRRGSTGTLISTSCINGFRLSVDYSYVIRHVRYVTEDTGGARRGGNAAEVHRRLLLFPLDSRTRPGSYERKCVRVTTIFANQILSCLFPSTTAHFGEFSFHFLLKSDN